MAQDVYLGAGGVKQLKSCYVGAGGVKEVTQIYIGQGGSPRFVWPPYIYSNGTYGTLCGGSATAYGAVSSGYYYTCTLGSSAITISASASGNTSEAAGAIFADTLSIAPYDTLTTTFNLTRVPTYTSRDVYFYLVLYNTKPTSWQTLYRSSYISYSTAYTLNNVSTGSKTISIDISGKSGSYYVGVYAYCERTSSNNLYFSLDVNQIYVS